MRPGIFDCGCVWDGRILNVQTGCGPDHHTDDLGANFPYLCSVPPREGSDGPEVWMWAIAIHGRDATEGERNQSWPEPHKPARWVWDNT